MSQTGSTLTACPHCANRLPLPPIPWVANPPYQCSHCGGLYGVGKSGMFAVPKDFKPLKNLMTWDEAKFWCHFSCNSYYCYAVCYPSGLPLYVGKGKADRMIQHGHCVRRASAKARGAMDEREVTIRLIHRAGFHEMYAPLYLGKEREALQVEALIIKEWGRRQNRGLLTNIEEGQLQEDPAAWIIPPQPAIKADGTEELVSWVAHPESHRFGRSHKGVLLQCPECNERFFHPGNIEIDGGRCPACAHYLWIDGKLVREFWSRQRPKVNQTAMLISESIEYACPPATPPPPPPAQRLWQGGYWTRP